MSDYIKREDAKGYIKHVYHESVKFYEVDEEEVIDSLVEALNALPSADVVEVVRCKDCRFGEWRSGIGYICGIRRLMDEHGIDGEGFCALGAREGGESDE